MKIGVLTRDRYDGRPGTLGSSLIRGDWLVKCQPETFEYLDWADYSAVIFQKTFDLVRMEIYRKTGAFIILDLVDPEWKDDRTGMTLELMDCVEGADAITVPTQVLADQIKMAFGSLVRNVTVIPDRTWLPYFDGLKKKIPDDFKKVGWFGYPENFPVLEQMAEELEELDLRLVVFSSQPHLWAYKNIKYNRATISQDLIDNCDVIINPRLNTSFFSHKSDSKSQWAAACGLPVAHTPEELRSFVDYEFRTLTAFRQHLDLRKNKRIEDSCRDYINLASSLASTLN